MSWNTELVTGPFTGTNRINGLCFDAQDNLYGCQSGGHLFRARTGHTGWIMWP